MSYVEVASDRIQAILGNSRQIIRAILTAAMVVAAAPVLAQQYPTIVGEWYMEDYGPQDCGTPFGAKIGPMSYAEDTYVCRFDDVRRDGWKVTWNGSCSDGNTTERSQVVALETRGQLSMWFNGYPAVSTLRRCPAR